MNLLLKTVFISVFLLTMLNLRGQSHFRSGYVITNNNDTLTGLVDYRNTGKNLTICRFKKDKTSDVEEYKPFGIKGFGFTGTNYFISKKVKLDGQEIPIFLEFLVEGPVSLYYYAKGSNLHYFVEKANGQMIDIKNAQDSVYKDGKLYIRESKRFTGPLRYAFSDCQKIFPLIDNATLQDKSMISLVKKYNECTAADQKIIVHKQQPPFIRIKFAPFISLTHSWLKFNDSYQYQTVPSKSLVSPSFGLLLNANLPKVSENFSLQLSGEYGKNSFYGTGISPETSAPEEVFINMALFKGKVGIKYTCPGGKIRPTIMVSLISCWISDKNGKIVDHAEPGSSIYIAEYKDYMIGNQPLTGYSFDFGFNYHTSSSAIPFFSLGFDTSRNVSKITPVGFFAESNFRTFLRTFHINAGVYF